VSGLDIRAPWRPLDAATAATLPPATGVYEIEHDGAVVYVGYAGARSMFGLRGVVAGRVADHPGARFRAEVTTAYLSRWRELLGAHLGGRGTVPTGNVGDQPAGLRPVGPRGATRR
jgi:hypothetical protein